jgi:acyl-CoA synthetase (AMP-forming)/AMP-acid ligase II
MALNKAVRRIAVVGIGMIGASWSAQYLARGFSPGASRDRLIAHCRRSLASYKVPRRVEFSDLELPKTGSGESLKRALRERFWAPHARAVS